LPLMKQTILKAEANYITYRFFEIIYTGG